MGNEPDSQISDDIGPSYLQSRQALNEYHSDAYSAFTLGGSESSATQEPPKNQLTETPKEYVANEGGTKEAQQELSPLETPWVDPTMAFTGGAAGAGVKGAQLGARLLPTLGKMVLSGTIGAVSDYPIGLATEAVGKKYPKLALPFNVITGMVSGATIEPMIEKAVVSGLTKGTVAPTEKAVTYGVKKVKKALETGKVEDDITASVVESLNKEADNIPLDKVLGDSTKPLYEIGPKTTAKANRILIADPELPEKYSLNINLNRINTTDDVKKIMHAVTGEFEKDIDVARRGVRSEEATKKAANLLGMTPETLLKRRKGQAFNAEEALSARRILVSSGENLLELAQKVRSADASDLDRVAFKKALTVHYAIQAQVSGMTAEAGRALQSFNIQAASSRVKLSQIKNLVEQLPGGVDVDRLAAALGTLDSVEGINSFVRNVERAKTSDMFIEAWINGLLWGPQTHAANTVSNTITAVWQIPERMLAAQWGRAFKGPRAVTEQEAVEQAFGMVEGIKDGLKAFVKVMKTGEATDQFGKVEARFNKAITAQNIQDLPLVKRMSPNLFQEGGVPAQAADMLGEFIRLPGRGLAAEDELFKSIGYRMELNARAYRQAVSEGLSGKAMADRIAEIKMDPELFAPDLHVAAVDAARYQTFTKPLGKAGKSLQQFFSSHPVLKLVVPFMRTPANIMKFAGERTPVAWMSKAVREELMAGGARRDLALAKMSLGSLVMSAASISAASGVVTGGGPSDPTEKATWYRTGWQPYSIKVGDTYVSFNRTEPIGMLFGLAADYAEISGLAGEELQPDVDKLATAILASISKNVTSKTWLRGVSDLIEAVQDPDRYGSQYINQLVSSLIPSISAQVERAVNPEFEEINGMVDSLKSRIPGLSTNMPKRRDLWGDPISTQISKDRTWAEIAYETVSPFYVSKAKDSPIDNEMIKIGLFQDKPSKKQQFNGIPIELTPQEYDRFIVLTTKAPLPSSGKNLKDTLDFMVQSDQAYRQADDIIKKEMIKAKFTEAKMQARQKLYLENQTIQKIVQYEQYRKLKMLQ